MNFLEGIGWLFFLSRYIGLCRVNRARNLRRMILSMGMSIISAILPTCFNYWRRNPDWPGRRIRGPRGLRVIRTNIRMLVFFGVTGGWERPGRRCRLISRNPGWGGGCWIYLTI